MGKEKKMKKRKLLAAMLICLLCILAVAPVYAAVPDGPDASVMALYYRSANADLTISSSGTATATGKVTGVIGTTTKTTVHLYLQQYKNGAWVDIGDWLDSGETASRTLTKTQTVEKGYKYRAKASCYAYAGTKSEHVTKYSAEVSY